MLNKGLSEDGLLSMVWVVGVLEGVAAFSQGALAAGVLTGDDVFCC